MRSTLRELIVFMFQSIKNHSSYNWHSPFSILPQLTYQKKSSLLLVRQISLFEYNILHFLRRPPDKTSTVLGTNTHTPTYKLSIKLFVYQLFILLLVSHNQLKTWHKYNNIRAFFLCSLSNFTCFVPYTHTIHTHQSLYHSKISLFFYCIFMNTHGHTQAHTDKIIY